MGIVQRYCSHPVELRNDDRLLLAQEGMEQSQSTRADPQKKRFNQILIIPYLPSDLTTTNSVVWWHF